MRVLSFGRHRPEDAGRCPNYSNHEDPLPYPIDHSRRSRAERLRHQRKPFLLRSGFLRRIQLGAFLTLTPPSIGRSKTHLKTCGPIFRQRKLYRNRVAPVPESNVEGPPTILICGSRRKTHGVPWDLTPTPTSITLPFRILPLTEHERNLLPDRKLSFLILKPHNNFDSVRCRI